MQQKSKIYQVSDDEFRSIIANNYTYSDCLRTLGLGTSGGSSTDILKQRINELQCSTAHFEYKGGHRFVKYDLEEILIDNSPYANISALKRRLLKEQLL